MALYQYFQKENVARGIPRGVPYQAGVSDVDSGRVLEQKFGLPWASDPAVSWLDYRCWIEVLLDAGMALHKPLPQFNPAPDTLGSVAINDPDAARKTGGVNLVSNGKAADIIQRMATSTYTFILKGYALRIGYQIPVPFLKTVAGVPAVPGEKQWSLGNRLAGNYGGLPLFENAWILEYYVALSPKQAQLPPANLAAHVRADQQLPKQVQVPFTPTDQNSQPGNQRVGT